MCFKKVVGAVSFYMWPYLTSESKGMVAVFGVIAALSIHNGTWTANTRALRKQAREERSEAFGQAYKWVKNKAGGGSAMPPPSPLHKEKAA